MEETFFRFIFFFFYQPSKLTKATHTRYFLIVGVILFKFLSDRNVVAYNTVSLVLLFQADLIRFD